MENSVYFYLFVSVDTFQTTVQIQFALKILKTLIKNIFTCYGHYWIWCNPWIQLRCCYTPVIVTSCHLYLLSCAGYPLCNTEGIIGQDLLRIIWAGNWATAWETWFYICEQQSHRSACASAQSDQHLRCSLPRQYKTLFLYQKFRASS